LVGGAVEREAGQEANRVRRWSRRRLGDGTAFGLCGTSASTVGYKKGRRSERKDKEENGRRRID